VPEGQAGAALQVKMPVPATLDIVLPLGQAGVGGVTAHVPVEAWKLPDEHVGETVQMYVVPGCVSVVVPGQTGEGDCAQTGSRVESARGACRSGIAHTQGRRAATGKSEACVAGWILRYPCRIGQRC